MRKSWEDFCAAISGCISLSLSAPELVFVNLHSHRLEVIERKKEGRISGTASNAPRAVCSVGSAVVIKRWFIKAHFRVMMMKECNEKKNTFHVPGWLT